MEKKILPIEVEKKIKDKAVELKKTKNVARVIPIVVFGNVEQGEKELYVAYLSEPSFMNFSKFMSAAKQDEVVAMKVLAKDCFLEGDMELVDNDSLFLFGLMGRLNEIIASRQNQIVNL